MTYASISYHIQRWMRGKGHPLALYANDTKYSPSLGCWKHCLCTRQRKTSNTAWGDWPHL